MFYNIKHKFREYSKENKIFQECYERLSCVKTRLLSIVPDKLYIEFEYYENTGERLNLKEPQTFNEKLQWLKLYDRNPLYTKLADKYSVREYVEERIGSRYLNELYGVYNCFDEINFKTLPEKFVLKCTHDCGSVFLCTNRYLFDENKVRKKINVALKHNYFWHGREWCYKNIVPRIIAEKYLADESGTELKDYKVFCFNGEPKVIQVDFDRFHNHRRNLYSTTWEYLGFTSLYPTDESVKIEKPKVLSELLDCAKKLSTGIPQVRVDFYIIDCQIVFGEMTLYHGNGFEKYEPEIWNGILGGWLVLPGVEEKELGRGSG